MEKYKKLILNGIFLILLLVSGYIRFAQSADYQFPFTYDQARDMVHVRIMGTFKDLPMVGPTTSINGVMLGPGYYYFNLLPYWIWGGNPQGLVYWNILWFLGSALVIYWFFYKRDIGLGFLMGEIYLFAPQLFSTSRYFWNAHAMIYFAVFYFLAMWAYWENKSPLRAALMGITVGVAMHFEAAFAIVLLAFSFVTVLASRNIKIIGWYLAGLIPWFLPQALFEGAKGFGMTKLLLSEFRGGAGILGEKLSLSQTITSHWQSIKEYMEGQFILPYGMGLTVLLTSLTGGLLERKYRRVVLNLILLLGFTFSFYTLVYHHELKKWYLDSLRVWYVAAAATGIMGWWTLAAKKGWAKAAVLVLVTIFLVRSAYLTVLDQKQFINNPNFAKDDPKLMEHLVKSVDWVYQKAEGKGFRAYNYVPELYDYPYQYLYWWYGREKYGYMPSEVSYLPGVPEYVPRQSQFYEDVKEAEEEKIGLIFERKGDYQKWLGNFGEYCVKERVDFDWEVSAEIRGECE